MPGEEISELINLYLKERCTPAQKQQVEEWFENYQVTDQEFYNQDTQKIQSSMDRSLLRLREQMNIADQPKQVVKFRLWKFGIAAAVVFVLLSVGLIFYSHYKSGAVPPNIYVNDILPGKNKAILTLADGREIVLDDAGQGKVASEAGILITKSKDGQLVYEALPIEQANEKPAYNMVSTPRGGQYQIKLPDGTHVWLNAMSSLRFPANFKDQKVRKVILTGEGYFEVAKNPEVPFVVSSDQQDVKVLGTHFNVNTYPDENGIKTTLLEGRVAVNNSTVLLPGEQSINKSGNVKVHQVDTEVAIAWKNGKFKFVNENIRSLMSNIARWYDVEVVYEGNMTNKDYSGSVSRFENVSKILDVLQSTNTIHFKVEGRRVTVMP